MLMAMEDVSIAVLECPPKAQLLKAWNTTLGTIGRWWIL
jgi:hypothetical protein